MRYADFPITVYAFHGCDESVAEAVFAGETELRLCVRNPASIVAYFRPREVLV